jgi:hypothetical protein
LSLSCSSSGAARPPEMRWLSSVGVGAPQAWPSAEARDQLLQLIVPALPLVVPVQCMFEVSIDGIAGVVKAGVVVAFDGMKDGELLFIMRWTSAWCAASCARHDLLRADPFRRLAERSRKISRP